MRPLRETLERIISALGMERRAREYQALDLWSEAVGADVADKTWPLDVRQGILFVGVSSPSWGYQLSLLKTRILSRLNARLGCDAIRDVRFQVRPPRAERSPAAPASPAAGVEEPAAPAPGTGGAGPAGTTWADRVARLAAAASARREGLLGRGWGSCPLCGAPVPAGERMCGACRLEHAAAFGAPDKEALGPAPAKLTVRKDR